MPADEAIVLAGGFGTRLRGIVDDVPKPLAAVAGRPFLAWLLDRLAASGMRRCILATGYMAEVIERVIGTRWQGMDIAYSVESEPLGTGGAIRLAAQRLQGDGVHVLNGDTWLEYAPVALEAAARAAATPMAIALARVDDVARYGAVDVRDGLARAGVAELAEVWCHAPPDTIGARYGARLHQRPAGHPGADYVPELIDLAKRATPTGLCPRFDVDTTGPLDQTALTDWLRNL